MIRKLVLVAAVAALTVGPSLAVASPASAAGPHGLACTLAGSAAFKPGLTATAKAYTYTFTGNLTNCQSTDATLKTGTVKATGKGSGTCVNGTGAGVAAIKWNNRKVTAIKFTTTSAGAAVDVATTVVKSVVISGVTYTTSEVATVVNDQGAGALAFQADATKCNTTTGLTTATFNGPIGSGNSQ
ncbi:MAG: hypothetical protein QOG64_3097 [Acidimicrobiaceae bacterium]|jgi:hypothetical protein|nr:hypothetical protein [Acidimicrobiaceae bacterium]